MEKSSMIPLLLVCFLLVSTTESKIRFQSFGVRGTLLCADAPAPGIRVRLWDNDIGELVDSPKHNSFTDFDGNFEFDDWTPYNDEVDPVIRIAHDCNDGVKPGQRLFKFKIPKAYVVEGKEAPKDKYFYLGTINLEVKPFNEERYNTGDYSKRSVRHTAHKIRARRQENVKNEVTEASKKASSEEDPCDFGLCTFSNDRKRRDLVEKCCKEEIVIAKEEKEEADEGCGSEGACPLHQTKRKRDLRERRDAQQITVEEVIESDEIGKKSAVDESGCSDGACSIDLSRKRRHEIDDCAEVVCPLGKSKQNTTKTESKFGGRDENPEDRIEPW